MTMRMHDRRERPEGWEERRGKIRRWWVVAFVGVEYGMEWVAYILSNWSFLEVLEYLGSFGVLIAVIFYFAESGDRLKQKHYQAWQVINSAQGKGGNGGRIEALEELNADGVTLVGVDLSSAFLVGVRLPQAKLARANFESADARNAEMMGAKVEDAGLRWANFRGAKLEGASFKGSALEHADFSEADLKGADLMVKSMEDADLRNANLEGVTWGKLQSMKGVNVYGVKNAPEGFVEWAMGHGAVKIGEEGVRK
ncbi:MAG: pentapeptide repeat-containing protein [Candidatus Acidiferrum sp.]